MPVFGTNDLITMACNLCTHLFYSFPALSKSSVTLAYVESESEMQGINPKQWMFHQLESDCTENKSQEGWD